MSFLSDKKKNKKINTDDFDEDRVVKAHKNTYGSNSNSSSNNDSGTIGAAAAMEALKMFSGSGSSSGGGKQDKNQLIGLAMSQAAKMMSGKPQEEKQSAVNQAAEMALKMYLKSGKDSSSSGGNSSSSGGLGAGDLLGLASKFLSK